MINLSDRKRALRVLARSAEIVIRQTRSSEAAKEEARGVLAFIDRRVREIDEEVAASRVKEVSA